MCDEVYCNPKVTEASRATNPMQVSLSMKGQESTKKKCEVISMTNATRD